MHRCDARLDLALVIGLRTQERRIDGLRDFDLRLLLALDVLPLLDIDRGPNIA
jgi:hypothetical protein